MGSRRQGEGEGERGGGPGGRLRDPAVARPAAGGLAQVGARGGAADDRGECRQVHKDSNAQAAMARSAVGAAGVAVLQLPDGGATWISGLTAAACWSSAAAPASAAPAPSSSRAGVPR